jgi:hypothetical protein
MKAKPYKVVGSLTALLGIGCLLVGSGVVQGNGAQEAKHDTSPDLPAEQIDMAADDGKNVEVCADVAETVCKAPEPVILNAVEGVLPTLKNIFRQEGIPSELVWIAEVESSWKAQAVSKAGAVGLFQLMPETARRFGLDPESETYDERIHPYKSGAAAARYLRVLHDQFGSWRLALAAYNAGEGRVRRLLQTHGATRFDQIQGQLPLETQQFIPRVLSTIADREEQSGASKIVRIGA